MTLAKVCGVTTREAVAAALDGGAAYLGFMVFPASPRHIALAAAAALARPARGRAKIVAVAVDPDDALADDIARVLAPDFIQLHGRETPSRAAELARRTGAGAIKAIAVAGAEDLDAARAYDGAVAHLMFDAKAPAGSPRPGGLGLTIDWGLLAGSRWAAPWFLAGGLDPWNAGDAVRLSGAPMVDVSSGVERGAGLKDPALITAFLEAVRRA
ncbi:MAG: phosphoribosylanthranilate isomerase [Caulobacteraceae bacterium]|nr:phosphoribosylanthranilate isomerase [Caulobacteraceae bacterium]